MMCEHEWTLADIEWIKSTKTIFTGLDAGGDEVTTYGKSKLSVCRHCGKSEREVELETALAAANATIEQQAREIERLSEGKEQAEAQNKLMQTAISSYVMGNIELLDALKAALEGKP